MPLFGPPNIDKLKAKRNIKGLIKALGYKNSSKTRAQAAKALGELGDDIAVTPLIQAYENEREFDNYDFKVRKQAWRALAKFKSDKVIRFMIASITVLNDSEIKIVGQTILKSDSQLQAHACKYSMDLLRQEGTRTSSRLALFRLLEIIGEAAIETLIHVLTSKDFDLIHGAEDALVKIGKPAVEPLIRSLRYEQWDISFHAPLILARIGNRQAIQPLIEMLKSKPEVHRGQAAEALAVFGDKDAVDPLIACLKDPETGCDRYRVADALVSFKDERAITPLLELLEEEDFLSWEHAVHDLGKLGW